MLSCVFWQAAFVVVCQNQEDIMFFSNLFCSANVSSNSEHCVLLWMMLTEVRKLTFLLMSAPNEDVQILILSPEPIFMTERITHLLIKPKWQNLNSLPL